MKAAYYEGDKTINVGDCKAVTPGAGEVRLNVAYCGICGTDLHIYHGKMDKRVTMPQVMGHELSGTVAEIGEGVSGLAIGQPVTVMPLDWCGECPACEAGHTHICQNLKFLGIDTPGAFQGSWTVPARAVLPMPEGVDLQMGALIEPIAVACHDIRLGGVKEGDDVVVLGGGPIGALVAMVARDAGAKVTVSEINEYRIKMLTDLGFDVVNPMQEDLETNIMAKTGNKGAEVVFEVTAHPAGIEAATKLPRTRGKIVLVGIFADPPKVDLFKFFWRELKLIGARVYEKEDFEKAINFVADKSLPLEVLVSKVLPLAELEDGFKFLESGSDAMKVLINCQN